MNSVPEIGTLTTEQYRQKLAGLLDPQAKGGVESRDTVKALAVRFAACLPTLYSKDLDRLSLWTRIGTALETAASKTGGGDFELFIQQSLDHIKAEASAAASSDELASIMATLESWSQTDREQWVMMFQSRLIPLLVLAKAKWGEVKEKKKSTRKSPNAKDPETLASFIDFGGEE